MPMIEVRGMRVHYEEQGTGEPLVWVSGTGISGRIWERFQLPHFTPSYRCITYDLRGCGQSDAPDEPYSVGVFAEDLAALLDALEITRAHFVGHSLGAAIIQELALGRPLLVKSAVLISTWSCTDREHHIARWFNARLLALKSGPPEVFRAFAFWMWAPSIIDYEPELAQDLEAFFAAHSSSMPLHAYINHFLADLAHDTRDRLPEIACPVLVVYGEEDLITLPWYNETVTQLVPNARSLAVRRAGHFVWAERPDDVNIGIQDFLAAVDRVEV